MKYIFFVVIFVLSSCKSAELNKASDLKRGASEGAQLKAAQNFLNFIHKKEQLDRLREPMRALMQYGLMYRGRVLGSDGAVDGKDSRDPFLGQHLGLLEGRTNNWNNPLYPVVDEADVMPQDMEHWIGEILWGPNDSTRPYQAYIDGDNHLERFISEAVYPGTGYYSNLKRFTTNKRTKAALVRELYYRDALLSQFGLSKDDSFEFSENICTTFGMQHEKFCEKNRRKFSDENKKDREYLALTKANESCQEVVPGVFNNTKLCRVRGDIYKIPYDAFEHAEIDKRRGLIDWYQFRFGEYGPSFARSLASHVEGLDISKTLNPQEGEFANSKISVEDALGAFVNEKKSLDAIYCPDDPKNCPQTYWQAKLDLQTFGKQLITFPGYTDELERPYVNLPYAAKRALSGIKVERLGNNKVSGYFTFALFPKSCLENNLIFSEDPQNCRMDKLLADNADLVVRVRLWGLYYKIDFGKEKDLQNGHYFKTYMGLNLNDVSGYLFMSKTAPYVDIPMNQLLADRITPEKLAVNFLDLKKQTLYNPQSILSFQPGFISCQNLIERRLILPEIKNQATGYGSTQIVGLKLARGTTTNTPNSSYKRLLDMDSKNFDLRMDMKGSCGSNLSKDLNSVFMLDECEIQFKHPQNQGLKCRCSGKGYENNSGSDIAKKCEEFI